jgi:exoribonuclease-2
MPSQNVLFEEAGQFKTGTIMQDGGQSLQIELASGKRTKVKQAAVMLRFDQPEPAQMMSQALQTAETIDLDFLWECAPQEEFEFQDLAGEYFGADRTVVQSAALLMRLHAAPVYFYRKGKGRYRPAQPETLRAALAALERKRKQEEEIALLADQLAAGELPPTIAARAPDLLVQGDKQSIEYRAMDIACQRTGLSPERLLLKVGALPSPKLVHISRFLRLHFPAGAGFAPSLTRDFVPPALDDLPDAGVEAFSIDDETTTEIDDCLSLQALPTGRFRIGVHIAAPALGISAEDPIDRVARERMTTVYSPGSKITMLPEPVVRAFSLDAGTERAALSLYVDVDPQTMQVLEQFSRLDRIRVAGNLRHNQFDGFEDEARFAGAAAGDFPHAGELAVLWRFTLAQSAERDRVRGKPEQRSRADFSFYVQGEEVEIKRRRRDAPIDRIVAEMAILANSMWGKLLADHGVSGLYRSQGMGRVKMSTHALEHQALGVAQYAWCTSPLRRYVDLVNQMQLIAVLSGEEPPFGQNDTSLFAILSAFETRYTSVNEYQQTMERFWCLRWVAQQPRRRLEATGIRDDTVRLMDAPLYFRVSGAPPLAAGQRLLVDVLEWDELDLTIQARVAQLLTDPDNPESVGSEALAEADVEPVEVAQLGIDVVEPRAGLDGLSGVDGLDRLDGVEGIDSVDGRERVAGVEDPAAVESAGGVEEAAVPAGTGHVGVVQPMGTESSGP